MHRSKNSSWKSNILLPKSNQSCTILGKNSVKVFSLPSILYSYNGCIKKQCLIPPPPNKMCRFSKLNKKIHYLFPFKNYFIHCLTRMPRKTSTERMLAVYKLIF